MKKAISWILTVATILACVCVGTVGSSAAEEIIIENGVLLKYSADDEFYEIPKEVKKIGENAFGECDNLREIYIGDNVTSIGSGAFTACESLEQICIAGTQAITVNGTVANQNVKFLINNDNRATRKSIAMAKTNEWSTYAVYTVQNKKTLTFLYGAGYSDVESLSGRRIIQEVKPYYILLEYGDIYFKLKDNGNGELVPGDKVDPGFFFRLSMNFNNLSKLRDKEEIENGNDGANSFWQRLRKLFRK